MKITRDGYTITAKENKIEITLPYKIEDRITPDKSSATLSYILGFIAGLLKEGGFEQWN